MNNLTLNPAVSDQRGYRLTSIDMVRGLVLLIMVLDHVRYFVISNPHDPMNDPNAPAVLYLTRLITHLCAPVFVFLAGTSAGLMTARKSPFFLFQFLLKRGLWLIFVEIAIVSVAWTFSPFGVEQMGGVTMIPMQVIWAIGASMVVLSVCQFLGRTACLYLGAVIILGHNFLDPVWPKGGFNEAGLPVWIALHSQMSLVVGQLKFLLSYPLLPWIGVMLLGFGAASLFECEPEKRNTWLRRVGMLMILAFIVLRASNLFGDSREWHYVPDDLAANLMLFFNTSKYPPSLHYVLMTLGPAAIICSYADQFKGWFKDTLVMFGRVPFVFYIAHLYIAHSIAVIIGLYQGLTLAQMMAPPIFLPKEFGLGLGGVYSVWLLVLVMLYPLCRWVASVKARRTDWWLSYV